MTDTHHRHASFFRRRERERERKRKSIRSLPFPPSTEFGKFYQPFGYIAGSNLEKGPRVARLVEINAHSRGIVRVTAAAPLGYQ